MLIVLNKKLILFYNTDALNSVKVKYSPSFLSIFLKEACSNIYLTGTKERHFISQPLVVYSLYFLEKDL